MDKTKFITIDPGVKNCCISRWNKKNKLIGFLLINFINNNKFKTKTSSTWVGNKIKQWYENNKEIVNKYKTNNIYIEQPMHLRWINISKHIAEIFKMKNDTLIHWVPTSVYRQCIVPNWKTGMNYKLRKQKSVQYVQEKFPEFMSLCEYRNITQVKKYDDICDAVIIGEYVSFFINPQ
jgi:hypothetical protein